MGEENEEEGSLTSLEFSSLIGLRDYSDSIVAAIDPTMRRASTGILGILGAAVRLT